MIFIHNYIINIAVDKYCGEDIDIFSTKHNEHRPGVLAILAPCVVFDDGIAVSVPPVAVINPHGSVYGKSTLTADPQTQIRTKSICNKEPRLLSNLAVPAADPWIDIRKGTLSCTNVPV